MSDRRHVPIHDHTNIYQGGKLRGKAITGVGTVSDGGSSGGGGTTTTPTTGFLTTTDGRGDVISTNAASGSTETIDLANGNVHDITLTENCTFTFTSPDTGFARSFTLLLRQDTTGSRLATWPASVYWPGGSAPTLATTAYYTDWIDFITVDGGSHWLGVLNAAAYHTPVVSSGVRYWPMLALTSG